MDVRTQVRRTRKQQKWTAVIGGIVAATIATLATIGVRIPDLGNSGPSQAQFDQSIETRLQNLELNDAKQSADISSIKEDTHHTRDRLDRYLDNKGY